MRAWPWRIVSLIAILATALAFATSQAWRQINVEIVNPPYVAPHVSEAMASQQQISAAFGRDFILMAAGPPQNALWQSQRAIAAEVRMATQPGAWEEQYQTADATWALTTTMVQYGWTSVASNSATDCDSGTPMPDVSAVARAAIADVSEQGIHACVDAIRGSTRLTMVGDIFLPTDYGASTATVLKAFNDLLLLQYDQMDPRVVDAPEHFDSSAARVDILRVWLLALIGLIGFSVIPPVIADRATWARIFSRIPRRFTNPMQTDVESATASTRSRTLAIGLVNLAIILWALRATEELKLDGVQSLAFLVGSFAASILVERMLMGKGARRSGAPKFTFLGTVAVLFGAVMAFAIAAGAFYLLDLTFSVQSLGIVPGFSEAEVSRAATVSQWGVFGILLLTWVPLAFARRIAMGLRRDNFADDGHAPVLLLRSFIDDKVRMRVRRSTRRGLLDQLTLRRWERFEEVAAASLSRIGPVLAVGTPGERLPPELGATRITLSHADWQERVADLTEAAALVSMTLGRTESLVWEIRRLRDAGLLHKTLFLVPPVSRRERRSRLLVLSQELSIPWGVLDTEATRRTVLAVCFPIGSEVPGVIVSRGPDDLSYEAAIDVAVEMLNDIDIKLPSPLDSRGAIEQMILSSAPARGEVIPANSAPPSRNPLNFLSQPATLRFLFAFNVFGQLSLSLLSTNVATQHGGVQIALPVGSEAINIGGWYKGDIVLTSGTTVYLVDIEKKTFDEAGELPAFPYELTLEGSQLCYTALIEPERHLGQIGCFDLDESSLIWSRASPVGTRAIAELSGDLYVTSPATNEVSKLDEATGEVEQSVSLEGVPWDLVSDGNNIFVSLIGNDTIVKLNPDDLATIRTLATVPSPSRLFVEGQEVWVHSSVANEITSVTSGGSESVFTRIRAPKIAAGPGILAIEGYEMLSIFRPGKGPVRLQLSDEGVRSLAVTGTAVVATDDESLWVIDPTRLP